MDPRLCESAFARAATDTWLAQTTKAWLWFSELVAGAVGALLLPRMLATHTSTAREYFVVLGAPTGVLAAFIICFLLKLFAAPYSQRDEARLLLFSTPEVMPLPNRVALREAIAEAQTAALGVARLLDRHRIASSPYMVDTDDQFGLRGAQRRHKVALESLGKQLLVAGHDYEEATLLMRLLIEGATNLNQMDLPFDPDVTIAQYEYELKKYVDQSLNAIDQLHHRALRSQNLAP